MVALRPSKPLSFCWETVLPVSHSILGTRGFTYDTISRTAPGLSGHPESCNHTVSVHCNRKVCPWSQEAGSPRPSVSLMGFGLCTQSYIKSTSETAPTQNDLLAEPFRWQWTSIAGSHPRGQMRSAGLPEFSLEWL